MSPLKDFLAAQRAAGEVEKVIDMNAPLLRRRHKDTATVPCPCHTRHSTAQVQCHKRTSGHNIQSLLCIF